MNLDFYEKKKAIKAASAGFSSYLMDMHRNQSDQSWMSFDEDTVLSLLYKNGHIDKMKKLILMGADTNLSDRKNDRTLAHDVAIKGDISTLKWLKEQGCNINAQDKFGRTPLLCSLTFDQGVGFYSRLLQLGADQNAKTLRGEDCMAVAIRCATKDSLVEALEILKHRDYSQSFELNEDISNNI